MKNTAKESQFYPHQESCRFEEASSCVVATQSLAHPADHYQAKSNYLHRSDVGLISTVNRRPQIEFSGLKRSAGMQFWQDVSALRQNAV
ncbi:hypothetical protein HRR99_07355 [Agrobacterium vaccinii]|uniref:hypothetical protein n=1 Tax=Agrobacterium vaccinii TaxID=2735528 RepID=UPI001E540D49|nr:hypothetical protein [Agrobacterium vaccinii]UHS61341.1 hypothetical protein HRR99_07355 [Agrobacterium vaccinii]